MVDQLPAGTYFLKARIPVNITFIGEGFDLSKQNFGGEYWSSSGSTTECSEAEIISITEGETVTSKDFQLEKGAEISGSVFQSDGITAVDKAYVSVFSGDPCGSREREGSYEIRYAEGGYRIDRLSAGIYYLKLNIFESVDQWWTSEGMTSDCAAATAITLEPEEKESGKDFILLYPL